MAHEVYDLDSSTDKIRLLRELTYIRIEIDTLKELLDRHGIISELEFESAKKYRMALPEYQALIQMLNQTEARINYYKDDPKAYLRDMFNAKLNGQL